MINLSKFHIVFFFLCPYTPSISTPSMGTCAKKVNNFVKQSKSSLLSPLGKIEAATPTHQAYQKTLENLVYILLTNLACSSTLHPYYCCNFDMGPRQCVPYSIKERIKIKQFCLSFSGQPFRLQRKKRKLGVSLVCHGYNMFDHSKSLLRVTPQVLSVHDFHQY